MFKEYLLKRVDTQFSAVKVGQTCMLKHLESLAGEIATKDDEARAVTYYGQGFRMYADDLVSVRKAWLGGLLERVENGVRAAAHRASRA